MIRIGTRGSLLATTQSGTIRDAIKANGHPCELEIITTPGDLNQGPVERIGVGVFTQALREAMAAGQCEVAVHSFKDLPSAPDERFVLVVPPREDPREALIARDGLTLTQLPEGARVGTSAPRRVGQLRALRPDLDIRPLRGNVDTRIGKVTSGELDAVVLAAAGLNRLGRLGEATQIFEPEEFMPAPAQGALAVEAVPDYARCILPLLDTESAARATAERAILSTLKAGCTAPIGAYSVLIGDNLHLRAGVFGQDGSCVVEGSGPVNEPYALGERLGRELIERGALDLYQD
ncbi:MAG: hydroxymethylbilane synthase [Corynebacterium sp.]|nr:hydroxymethylbilane synthase [Corynebacterium sp.]